MSRPGTPSGPTDAAALAGSAVAASISLSVTDGPYGALSLIMSLSLLLIIFAYLWGHERDGLQSVATAGAIAIAAVPGAGFFLELGLCHAGIRPDGDGSRVRDWMVGIVWALATVGCAFWDPHRQKAPGAQA